MNATTNKELLEAVAAKLGDGWCMMNSKWQNCETEVIAYQTIKGCAKNLRDHGDPFSWLMIGATSGRQICGTDNAAGLRRLLGDGSIVKELYDGTLTAPHGVVIEYERPVILRVTDLLLRYVDGHVESKRKDS